MSYFTSDLTLFPPNIKHFLLPERLAAVFDSEVALCGINRRNDCSQKDLSDESMVKDCNGSPIHRWTGLPRTRGET
jgi:hypothetical protein